MFVKFTEGAASVLVPGVGPVNRGDAVEVEDEQGERLLAQGWKAARKPKNPATDADEKED